MATIGVAACEFLGSAEAAERGEGLAVPPAAVQRVTPRAHRPARVGAPTPALAWKALVWQYAQARTEPGGAGHVVATVTAREPYWGGPNVLLVLNTKTVGTRQYLKVLLKRRPAGTTGWIPAGSARLSATTKRVVVSLSRRTLVLEDKGRPVLRTRVVVGSRATPTPVGTFAVDAAVRQPARRHLGRTVLAVTAYSEALRTFDHSIPQMAVHDYEQLGAPLGTAGSHGCVRVPDRILRRLVAKMPRGAPFVVRR